MLKFYPFPVLALALLSACETMPVEPEADVSRALLSGEACPYDDNGAHLFWMSYPSRQVGETVEFQPYFSTHPGHMEMLPAECIGDMTAMPEDAVTFSRDQTGRVAARLTDQAKPDTQIIIDTNYGGHTEITGIVKVYDAAANPLVGTWTQVDDGNCSGNSRILELKFEGDGDFSVTWRPFEAYKDYWGEFDYELETGMLFLRPESGNYIPEDVSSGAISLSGDEFTLLDGMSFGSTRGGEICSAPFRRR